MMCRPWIATVPHNHAVSEQQAAVEDTAMEQAAVDLLAPLRYRSSPQSLNLDPQDPKLPKLLSETGVV